jgi:zinc transporter ZupT
MKQVVLYLLSMIAGLTIGYLIFKPIVEDTAIALLIGFCLGVMTGISLQPLAKKKW